MGTIFLLELALNCLIVKKVAYTEIDWVAYMDEVGGYIDGERNYYNLKGGTGPLVYPAGFLYIYQFIRYIAGGDGRDIRKAQWFFVFVYLVNRGVVGMIYKRCLVEGRKGKSLASGKWCFLISMCLLSLSKRVHSLYFLRLFNDTITVLLMNAAILLFVTPTIKHNNYLGSLLYSLSISVKMNSLLYAPAVLLFYLQSSSLQSTIISLSICAGVQLVLGYPFLSTYPIPYLRKAFELDRVFFYKWTVNLKFLPESTFVSKPLSTFLLSLHVLSLAYIVRRFILLASRQKTPFSIILSPSLPQPNPPTPFYVCSLLWSVHFAGIAFARTLHYQFYSWYFDSLPLLCLLAFNIKTSSPKTDIGSILEAVLKFGLPSAAIMGTIEYAFNIYPATTQSSVALQIAHAVLMAGLVGGGMEGVKVYNKGSRKMK